MRYGLLYLLLLLNLTAQGQDLIIKKNGDTLIGKVTLVTPNQVQYKKYNSADTTINIIPASSLSSVIYPNGTRDTFNAPSSSYFSYGNMSMSDKGKEDARMYYKKYRSAKTFTTIISLYPLAGIIPAAIISAHKPKPYNLGYPSYTLMNNNIYRDSYNKEAYRIKKRKTWGGVLLGTGIILGFAAAEILVLAATMH